MASVPYDVVQLAKLSQGELARVTSEEGLAGVSSRGGRINRLLDWQSGRNYPPSTTFSAGMIIYPIQQAYGKLLDFYDTKKRTARALEDLSPMALELVLRQVKHLPPLPLSPHSLRVAYLLMYDRLEVGVLRDDSVVAQATSELRDYYRQKDAVVKELLSLTDAALFGVVDLLGAGLVPSKPYVMINGISYANNLEVVYYLVVLQVR